MKNKIARLLESRISELDISKKKIMADSYVSTFQLNAVLQSGNMKGTDYTFYSLQRVCRALGVNKLTLDFEGNQVTIEFKG